MPMSRVNATVPAAGVRAWGHQCVCTRCAAERAAAFGRRHTPRPMGRGGHACRGDRGPPRIGESTWRGESGGRRAPPPADGLVSRTCSRVP
eukprot:4393882-Prymnesium_polylepis.1